MLDMTKVAFCLANDSCGGETDLLECFACSNTEVSKRCSDQNGRPVWAEWSILRSPSAKSPDEYRLLKLIDK